MIIKIYNLIIHLNVVELFHLNIITVKHYNN